MGGQRCSSRVTGGAAQGWAEFYVPDDGDVTSDAWSRVTFGSLFIHESSSGSALIRFFDSDGDGDSNGDGMCTLQCDGVCQASTRHTTILAKDIMTAPELRAEVVRYSAL